MEDYGVANYNAELARELQCSRTDVDSPTTSAESYGYFRTASELSSSSGTNDFQGNTSGEPSPQKWPMANPMHRTTTISSRFKFKQLADILDERYEDEASLAGDYYENITSIIDPLINRFFQRNLVLEMMKEKFSKLLLGEDMSGSGKGVCTAVAISNAITNLYATIFGQFKRLQPLSYEKKSMWLKEMDCLLSVCDYIYESVTSQDEATTKVPGKKVRSDISMNLPALQKLDTMLLEILDSFRSTEFWYIEKQKLPSKAGTLGSVRWVTNHNEEKWWLPLPCVPPGGLSDESRTSLQQTRKRADQIHKAAAAINNSILSEMDVPETYTATLPKTGRTNLGDAVYRYMSTAEHFSPEYLLDCIDMKSEHEALDVADRLEASMYVWRRKACLPNSISSWHVVKGLNAEGDKNVILATRTESVLRCLKQIYPQLSQTTLDACKIQYNKDVGQAILESYSRVLESLAFNVVARIDDVLYIDTSTKGLL